MSDIQRMSGSFEGPEAENGAGSADRKRSGIGNAWISERILPRIQAGSEECSVRSGVMTSATTVKMLSRGSVMTQTQMWKNTADSVFCSHGAGIIVPWYEVEEHMHVESGVKETVSGQELPPVTVVKPVRHTIELTQAELDAIYVRTPGSGKEKSERPSGDRVCRKSGYIR